MSQVLHHVREGFHVLLLDAHASRNALSPEMVQALDAALARAQEEGARAIVLRGAQGMFSAGGNIGNFAERLASSTGGDDDPVALRNREFGRFLERLSALDVPTVAVVEGAAIGGGLGLAGSCDFVLAHSEAKFSLSETSLGIVPAQIAPFLLERLGVATLRRLTLAGRRFDGRVAQDLGLVDELFDTKEALDAGLAALLSAIGRCAPRANQRFKRLLRDDEAIRQRGLWLDAAARCFSLCMNDEGGEGIAAFRDKRAARWQSGLTAADVAALPVPANEEERP
ncbi:enoyl-CoA hydratase/isomerase family protein [Pseudomonas jinjuensis]|uniref:Isohexenylglutaconyl-CoA hydratase n=1 Tax=Pseudomonas jinjuensis TaxID=198616 RepID=A0A1H0C9V5_9PSED|nr:enoyl-CoA hydratase/isomerase family protein [Pseudomonas jinjuensis]SDN54591.1 isohexenylglutaconyl-CoA hydratase [Pseudomonas jinjuensis]